MVAESMESSKIQLHKRVNDNLLAVLLARTLFKATRTESGARSTVNEELSF